MTWLDALTAVIVAFFVWLIVIAYCDMKKTQAIEETKRVEAQPPTNVFGLPVSRTTKSSS